MKIDVDFFLQGLVDADAGRIAPILKAAQAVVEVARATWIPAGPQRGKLIAAIKAYDAEVSMAERQSALDKLAHRQ